MLQCIFVTSDVSECTRHQVCSVATAVTVLGLFIVGGVFLWLFVGTNTPAVSLRLAALALCDLSTTC